MIKKGSFTVEAACVMPLILFTLMGLLYLCFFVHNRVWLTAAAYESAISGAMEGIWENGSVYETAQRKGEGLGSSGFFGAENLSLHVKAGKDVQVIYDEDTIAEYTGLSWHLRAEGKSRIIRPVGWIRKIKAASNILGEIGG